MTENMIPYNTDMKRLVLPEYGRNVHRMIEYCVGIPDREERNACARSIARIMANIYSETAQLSPDDPQIWNHMNLMADFKLDVDFPCEVLSRESLTPNPNRVPYPDGKIRFRHYGKGTEQMIKVACEMEDSPERDAFISLVAHHMKKLLTLHNKEAVSNEKVIRDLAEFSGGKIQLDPATYVLRDFQETPVANNRQGGKKKKKKN